MLKIILIALPVLIVLFCIVVTLQPASFRVTRSATISAPPERVFSHVNDLKQWEAWSPWVKLDPNAKSTFSGPAAGTGASMTWAGNREVGEGRMTITDSQPNKLVQLKLEFLKPFQAVSTAEFTFTPQGNATEVTWTMSGQNDFMGKAVSLFMDCDKMIGGQFEKGLASLNTAVTAAKQ
ncbi:MAG TPA: SRPBCC family protein [Dongiaceae bacterium]|jgi:uncharacterized protein YndB with AHSA1/START domain|nr:SRPBCC family protein [Dongiaceae bacterium]